MKVFCHLLWRELRDRRLFFLGASAVGFVPWLVATLAFRRGHPFADQVLVAAVLVAMTLVAVPLARCRWLVAGFGPGGRRGFELVRPVTAWQLAAAKLAAILAMALGGAFLVGLPTLSAAPRQAWAAGLYFVDSPFGLPAAPVFLGSSFSSLPVRFSATEWLCWRIAAPPLLVLLILAAAQAAAFVPAAGRRLWADLGAWALLLAALSFALRRLADFGAFGAVFGWIPFLAGALVLLGAASAGRSFAAGVLARAHHRFSCTMNGGLLALAVLLVAAAWGATRPDIAALSSFSLLAANADGSIWLVGGRQEGSQLAPIFLVEPASGRVTYAGPLRSFASAEMGLGAARLDLQENPARWERLHLEPGRPPLWVGAIDYSVYSSEKFAALDADGGLEVTVHASRLGPLLAVRRLPAGPIHGILFPELDPVVLLGLRHRQGTLFDLAFWRVIDDVVTRHFEIASFDAATGVLERKPAWHTDWKTWWLGNQGWWAEALPILQNGVPLEVVAEYEQPRPLAAGGFLVQEAAAGSDLFGGQSFVFLNSQGACTGSLSLPADAYLGGEIRPGLLLAPLGAADLAPIDDFSAQRDAQSFATWTTLVIDSESGRILRRLPGFAPNHPRGLGDRTFLVGPWGEPYDLDSAAAEPRRLLPWRPRRALGFLDRG